ncbi:MAG: hypothetical protein BGO78_03270 [Chloroflexi bacterium 44-23]|nr:MAG: hypothetical protein BGO78_03270 [Chloroflexi bacterium 44-23]
MQNCESRKSQIDNFRENIVENYRQIWANMIADWSSDDPRSLGWLMYSANYLFRTNKIYWAVDPFLLSTRIAAPFWEQQISDLSKLDFVLLTHRHNDHFDRGLIHALRDFPIQWVVPQEMRSDVLELINDPKKIVVATHGKLLTCSGMNIMPFNSLHFDDSRETKIHGVPETGYLVQFQEKKWLFPGDIRNYRAELLPEFGPVDLLFAHLWLGRKSGQADPPPLLEQFCEFCLALQPAQIVISHLYEAGRKPDSLWDLSHFEKVKRSLEKLSPNLPISAALIGQKIQI